MAEFKGTKFGIEVGDFHSEQPASVNYRNSCNHSTSFPPFSPDVSISHLIFPVLEPSVGEVDVNDGYESDESRRIFLAEEAASDDSDSDVGSDSEVGAV